MKLRALWFAILALFMTTSTGVAIHFANTGSASVYALSQMVRSESEASEVSILLTGDIMLGRYIKTLRSRNGEDFPFTYMPEILEQAERQLETEKIDLVVGNLEGPISTVPYVNPGTAMRFNFEPEVAELLAKVGFTTLDLANNHALDQGQAAYNETIEFLNASGLDAFGHADTHNGPHSFFRYEFDELSIGFLGLHDATVQLDMPGAIESISKLDSEVDFLIVGVHWGPEYLPEAPPYIVEMAHQMVDAGADFIWGHHPHVVQNSEIYNQVPIYYSLGNFVFDQYWSKATQEGQVVALTLTPGGGIRVTDFMVDLINLGEPRPR